LRSLHQDSRQDNHISFRVREWKDPNTIVRWIHQSVMAENDNNLFHIYESDTSIFSFEIGCGLPIMFLVSIVPQYAFLRYGGRKIAKE
jgi:hypothetical protein